MLAKRFSWALVGISSIDPSPSDLSFHRHVLEVQRSLPGYCLSHWVTHSHLDLIPDSKSVRKVLSSVVTSRLTEGMSVQTFLQSVPSHRRLHVPSNPCTVRPISSRSSGIMCAAHHRDSRFLSKIQGRSLQTIFQWGSSGPPLSTAQVEFSF